MGAFGTESYSVWFDISGNQLRFGGTEPFGSYYTYSVDPKDTEHVLHPLETISYHLNGYGTDARDMCYEYLKLPDGNITAAPSATPTIMITTGHPTTSPSATPTTMVTTGHPTTSPSATPTT